MTRAELLKKMKLKDDEELKDLLQKFRSFSKSLNKRQRAVVSRSLPTLARAAKTFGPGITATDLKKHLGLDSSTGGFGAEVMSQIKNDD